MEMDPDGVKRVLDFGEEHAANCLEEDHEVPEEDPEECSVREGLDGEWPALEARVEGLAVS